MYYIYDVKIYVMVSIGQRDRLCVKAILQISNREQTDIKSVVENVPYITIKS